MQKWKMLLIAPIGAMLLGAAGSAMADDRGRDRSDRRVEHRFTDGGRHDRRDNHWERRGERLDWRHDGRNDRWGGGDRRDWQKDKWATRQARERHSWERRADNLGRRAELLREYGRFREAERLEGEARRLDRRADRLGRDGRDGRPYIRWNSY